MSLEKDGNIQDIIHEEKLNTADPFKVMRTSDEDVGMLKTAGVYSSANLNNPALTSGIMQPPYSAPFITLSDTKLPQTSLEIFKWCKYVFMFDPLISGAVNALATFPVTEINLEDMEDKPEQKMQDAKNTTTSDSDNVDDDSDDLKLYRRVLFDNLHLYRLLVEIGLDYQLYGNCILFGEFGPDPENEKQVIWKRIVRLPVDRIVIDYNPATGDKQYKWMLPAKIKKLCRDKKPIEEYEKVPDIIKDAVKKDSAVILNPNNVYHFARPADSSGDNPWGIPLIANVLKLIMYRNTLRQAQEAIAKEHIVPFRIFCMQPNANGTVDPNTNWGAVARNFAGELAKTVRDPNYKIVSPVPIQMIEAGGNGRALLLTPEIEQVQNEILAGMNVPREFIFGGVSYSGASIAIKILENNFITYRLFLDDFINNFLIKGMAKARHDWVSEKDNVHLITAHMQDMKMQDDVQQKQLIINLNQAGKISNEYMWKMLGMDAQKMRTQLEQEAIANIQLENKLNAERIRAQIEQQYLQQQVQMEMQQKYPQLFQQMQQQQMQQAGVDPSQQQTQPQQAEQAPADQQQTQPQQAEQAPADQQAAPSQAANVANAQQMEAQNAQPANLSAQFEPRIQNMALQMLNMTDGERLQMYAQMPKEDQEKVYQLIQMYQAQTGENPDNSVDMRPMPEQRPPRRNSLK